ncbi:MAG: PIN domain-containing protein, partial [Thermoplasmata archaeon]
MPKKQSVILDANALLMPFQHNINLDMELRRLLGECEVLVPSSVLGELRRLARRNRNAGAALALARKYAIAQVEEGGDTSLISLAREKDAVVVTNDRSLIRELRKSSIPVVYLRSRTHLVVEGL